jgi:hypothetical protein
MGAGSPLVGWAKRVPGGKSQYRCFIHGLFFRMTQTQRKGSPNPEATFLPSACWIASCPLTKVVPDRAPARMGLAEVLTRRSRCQIGGNFPDPHTPHPKPILEQFGLPWRLSRSRDQHLLPTTSGRMPKVMYQELTRNYHTIAKEVGIKKIIPVGNAFQLVAEISEWKFARDSDFDYKNQDILSFPKNPIHLMAALRSEGRKVPTKSSNLMAPMPTAQAAIWQPVCGMSFSLEGTFGKPRGIQGFLAGEPYCFVNLPIRLSTAPARRLGLRLFNRWVGPLPRRFLRHLRKPRWAGCRSAPANRDSGAAAPKRKSLSVSVQ